MNTPDAQIRTVDFNIDVGTVVLGSGTFNECASLTGISMSGLSKSISIDDGTFNNCVSLAGFTTYGISVLSIGEDAFARCKLTEAGINTIVAMPSGFVHLQTEGVYSL
jgi:hypothetical protein